MEAELAENRAMAEVRGSMAGRTLQAWRGSAGDPLRSLTGGTGERGGNGQVQCTKH